MSKTQPEQENIGQEHANSVCSSQKKPQEILELSPCILEADLQERSGNASGVLLTYQKAQVPELLQKQGVTRELWWQSHAAVTKLSKTDAEIKGSIIKMVKRVPLAPFLYPQIKTNQVKLVKDWHNLISKLQPKYAPFGIHVTLARDKHQAWPAEEEEGCAVRTKNSDLSKKNNYQNDAIVRLKFEVWNHPVEARIRADESKAFVHKSQNKFTTELADNRLNIRLPLEPVCMRPLAGAQPVPALNHSIV